MLHCLSPSIFPSPAQTFPPNKKPPTLHDDALVLCLEPLHGLLTLDLVGKSYLCAAELALVDPVAATSKTDVEVHAINARGGVVLDTQVDVLSNTKAEVASR